MTSQRNQRIRLTAIFTIIAVAGLFWAGPTAAQVDKQDLPGGKATEGGVIHQAFDYMLNNTYIRAGIYYQTMTGSSEPLTINDSLAAAIPLLGGAPDGNSSASGYQWPGTGVGVDSEAFPALTVGLYIPNTGKHLAIEGMLAAPLELTVEVRGNAIDKPLVNAKATPPIGKTVGSVKALPPNLTLVYRPWVDTMIQPYIGIGAMYLYTYDTEVTNYELTKYGEPTLYLSKPMACVGQAGVDVSLTEHIFINADVKYIGCADVVNKLNGVKAKVAGKTVEIDMIESTLHYEALLYSLNVGIRF